ncbi:transcription termination factor 3, mitochondrial-like [Limulus polyphemus]|uniref:Transcription termination factor 3, mitochondrial-like n=1 Tax=Limulus polyphemus TaxID=6850 RepID=A0ABM1C1A7_LIMPO|nr:transcription termination factor 3, mitochondrial-like [Limulus polyphemus]
MRITGFQLITRRLSVKQGFFSRILIAPKIPFQVYQKHFMETTCRLLEKKSNEDLLYFQHLFYETHPNLKTSKFIQILKTLGNGNRDVQFDPHPVSQVQETNNQLDLLPHDPLSSSLEAEFIDNLAPVLSPSFNLAAYATRSRTLQELVKLGVDLSRIEKRAGLAKFVLKLDFDKNIKHHIQFLHDLGVPSDELGTFLTHNPLIFKESLDDLQVRVNYLESKKFSTDSITRIVSKAPFWLLFSTKRIDRRLGFFQKEFQLTGDELRHIVTRLPKLALWSLHKVKQTNFSVKEEMGFSEEETKQLLIKKPKIWLLGEYKILLNLNLRLRQK